MLPSESFVHRFPTPLAAAWRNTELTRAPAERRAHVIAAADVAIRLVLAILKADYDRDTRTSKEVSSVFEKLVQASWGRWGDAVTALTKALRARGGAVTSPLVDLWLSPSGGAGPAQLAFRNLIPLRNESAHKGPALSAEVERQQEAAVRTAAVAFLEALEPLADLMLFRTGANSSRRDGTFEGPWSIYRGTDEVVVPRHVTWTGHIDERRLQVWLPHAGKALLVEPYLRVSPVASLNMDGLHLFSGLDRQGRLILRHDRSGAEQVIAGVSLGDANASPVVITSGLARESGTLPVVTGRLIGRRYELRRRLQRGSVCDVFEGVDTNLGRAVAVKVLRDDVEPSADLVHRFERESEVLARLEHPNIVRVLDHVQDEDGRSALILEMVAGGSLRDQVGHAGPGEVLSWMRDALTGLAYAHAAGVVHRDLRPDNILVGADGVARLADFDLAAVPGASGSANLTRTRFGIVGYLAPELLTGAPVSPASDVYALGTTWDELLHGELRSRAEFGVGLNGEARDVIVEMTAASPSSRPSAAELIERVTPRRRSRANTTETGALRVVPTDKPQSQRWFPWFVGMVMTAFVVLVGWAIGNRYFGGEGTGVRPAEAAGKEPVATVVSPPPALPVVEPAGVALAAAPAPSTQPPLPVADLPIPRPAAEPAVAPPPTAPPPPAPVLPPVAVVAPAQGLSAAVPSVIPARDEPTTLESQPLPMPSAAQTTTLGWWYFDTRVMGFRGKASAGVIAHFEMEVADTKGEKKLELHHRNMTALPDREPGVRKEVGYRGTASWPARTGSVVTSCIEMRKDGEMRDERWFLFQFAGDSVRGWWVSKNVSTATIRWGALLGGRRRPAPPESPTYSALYLAPDGNDCAHACFENLGGFPCSGLPAHVDECVSRCIRTP